MKSLPFAEWVSEEESQTPNPSTLSFEEIKKLKEIGLLQLEAREAYSLAYTKFLEDPKVNELIQGLKDRFSEYTNVIFPYDDYEWAWHEIISEEADRTKNAGWFEYLMFIELGI